MSAKKVMIDWAAAHRLAGEIIDALEANVDRDEVELVASIIHDKRSKWWSEYRQKWLAIGLEA